MSDLSFWQKATKNLYPDLEWNIPEQKTGSLALIGGNSGNFSNVVRSAEFLTANFPLKSVRMLLPDALKNKLPPLPNLDFLPSTDSGSLAKSPLLNDLVANADFSIFIGELSKNSATTIAISDAIKNSDRPVLLTRDAIDSATPEAAGFIERENLFVVGSLLQLQKLFRALYYPKMILLSMPLVSAVETLHKFTLSYPVTILTFHQDQIIIASGGKVVTIPLDQTSYTPPTLWGGQLACKIAAMNLFSPGQNLAATVFAVQNRK